MNLSIIIPAYNEQDNLPKLIDNIEGIVELLACQVEVIVVDDKSTDNTYDLMLEQSRKRPWLRVLSNPDNKGMGAALKSGTAKASHPLVAWIMADRSDRLNDLIIMHRKLVDGADLVLASRAAQGGGYGDFIGPKAFGSRMFSQFACKMLKIPAHDITNAFRAFRKDLIEKIPLQRDDFAISPEMVIRAAFENMKIEELPTVYMHRKHGMSNFKVLQMGFVYGFMALRAWLYRMGFRKTLF